MFPFFSNSKTKTAKSSKRNPKTLRLRTLRVECLEERRVLSATTFTDYEQLILELVNRARMDPAGEVALNSYVGDLNDGVSGTAITLTPKQPLAPVQTLTNSGRLHAQDMIDNDYFSHYGLNESTPTSRGAAAGYLGPVGENIAWNGSTGSINQEYETYKAHENLFKSPPHRVNMMHDTYEVAGIGVRFGEYTSGMTYNVAMTVEQFSFTSGDPYITGVVYEDGRAGDDDFYSIGESVADVQITAVNSSTNVSYSTISGTSGGYTLPVPAGTYVVTATGGSEVPMVASGVVVAAQNVKVDFDTSQAPVPEPEPELEPGPLFDLVGVNSNEQFWVGESDANALATKLYGQFPSTHDLTNVATGDFNGDGLDDIVGRMANGSVQVALATGASTFDVSTWGTLTNAVTWTEFHVGDFNGDGLDDVLVRAGTDGSWWLAKSDGDSFGNTYWGSFTKATSWTIVVGDFSGDGLDDVAGRAGDGTWWVGTSSGTGFANSYWGKWTRNAVWSDINVGDFNGDGKDDIAGRAQNAWWWVSESLGDGFYSQYRATWTPSVDWQDVVVGDFDGDGNDDIAGRGNGQWWIAISHPASETFSNHLWGVWPTTTSWHDVQIFDINGDHKSDVIGRADNGQWWTFQSTGSAFTGRLATTWSPGATWQYVGVGDFM